MRRPSPIPRNGGIYAWYFREIPPGVPTDDCIRHGELTLLYVGIAPKAPPKNGRSASTQTLRDRVRYHYRGNAEGSTLRLTLGCLLSEQLKIALRRVGSGSRFTFANGEEALSSWMAQNAFVTWCEAAEPWKTERETISRTPLPLNLEMNAGHPFCSTLSSLRRAAKSAARNLPIEA